MIYVASSWRNEHQPAVVAALRESGHEVYDMTTPRSWQTYYRPRAIPSTPAECAIAWPWRRLIWKPLEGHAGHYELQSNPVSGPWAHESELLDYFNLFGLWSLEGRTRRIWGKRGWAYGKLVSAVVFRKQPEPIGTGIEAAPVAPPALVCRLTLTFEPWPLPLLGVHVGLGPYDDPAATLESVKRPQMIRMGKPSILIPPKKQGTGSD